MIINKQTVLQPNAVNGFQGWKIFLWKNLVFRFLKI